ncbi:DUF1800 domain-containing protein [Rhodobacter ferrooxidans]|uniref:DUF1800 domain-containing protein n=1 Tax=Rhodobacter ferrooxidans TaxID=371731 RepID=C8RX10_9RHOB|nr:DUF1800 domain-containing protein [Rhodobacter sp. SW2]EEW26535.1 Protein of unknown function DUF1800 [Rhodobacter sp. SW2]
MDASAIELIRFGYGPKAGSSVLKGSVEPDRLLAQLADPAPVAFARPGLAARLQMLVALRQERQVQKAGGPKTDTTLKALRQMQREDTLVWVPQAAATKAGFHERLVNFWANRLTVASTRGELVYLVQPYRDEAVRPHVAGRFAELLLASVWHPAMLLYLDQARSVGPNSRFGLRRRAGLNENFARELLELHTMATGYTQADVTALAALLTGLTFTPEGAAYDENRAEPGQKTVLGQSYGEGADEIAHFVEDLSMRPETAQSVCLALARHFLSDTPPEALVARMAQTYLAESGALVPVYRLLLQDPAARDPVLRKIRSPHEFVVASLRAFDLTGAETQSQGAPKGGFRAEAALAQMGQPVYRPRGPDGWPDTAAEWISPPYMVARLDWAERLARLRGERADPVALARQVLGDLAHPDTLRAVGLAEQRWEGVAVLLGSPDFMRR